MLTKKERLSLWIVLIAWTVSIPVIVYAYDSAYTGAQVDSAVAVGIDLVGITGMVECDGAGNCSQATDGTDYISPTTLTSTLGADNDTQAEINAKFDAKVGDTGNETVAGIKTFSSFLVTPSAAPTTDYQVANKKYVDDNVVAGGISSVGDDNSGAVPILYQAIAAFSDADATPDVSAGQHFRTANTGATSITDFDGAMLSDGRLLTVFVNDANTTIDLSSSGIEAGNRTTDYAANNGDVLSFIYSTTDNQWHALNMPDPVETLGDSGIVVNNAGTPLARSIAGAGLASASNADGTAGNPTITVPAEDSAGVNTGTATDEAITADALAGSTFGTIFVTLRAYEAGTSLATGDGKDYWTVPPELNGMNLVSVFGAVYTASSSGLPNFQIHNLTDTQDMLSTALTIDATELNSSTATTAAVINASFDDVATGDIIRLDCDAAGTGTAGGDVILGFRLP